MAEANSTAEQDYQHAIDMIVSYRKLILKMGHDSFFSQAERLSDKARRSQHMTMCVMFDELADAIEVKEKSHA